MKKNHASLNLLAAAALVVLALPAQAIDLKPDAVSLQAGGGRDHNTAVGVGVVWDWNWRESRRVLFTGQTELIVSQWRAEDFGGGHMGLQQIILLPVVRMQLDEGRSPWFLELGIGASYLTRDYVTPNKVFSTRWNFYDMLGAGLQFGAGKRQELGLRYIHISNAGIRNPNPGEDLLQLRYAVKF